MTPSRRFCLVWLISLPLLLLLVGAINFVIDPYDVFGSVRMVGLNQFKPQAKNHMMLAKTYQVARVQPVTVLVGSSRVLIGLDAKSPWLSPAMRPVYNYGVPGVGTYANYRSLQEAFWRGRLKNALIFLDFENFLAPDQEAAAPGEAEWRFHTREDGSTNPNRPLQLVKDSLLSLFTLGALEDSIATILAQSDKPALDLGHDGSATEAEFIQVARTDGYNALFAQKNVAVKERAANAASAFANWHGPSPNLDDVAKMIAFCRTHGIGLTLAIPPTHADALEIYWAAGLWPRLEQWKTELASVVGQEDGGESPLWDFEGYDFFATEPVPSVGDLGSATKWFWEPSHFKKSLGELMLQRIFGTGSQLGVRLTADNVAMRNAAVRAEREAYLRSRVP